MLIEMTRTMVKTIKLVLRKTRTLKLTKCLHTRLQQNLLFLISNTHFNALGLNKMKSFFEKFLKYVLNLFFQQICFTVQCISCYVLKVLLRYGRNYLKLLILPLTSLRVVFRKILSQWICIKCQLYIAQRIQFCSFSSFVWVLMSP